MVLRVLSKRDRTPKHAARGAWDQHEVCAQIPCRNEKESDFMLMPNELHAEAVSGPELYRPLFPARGFPHRFVIWRGGPRREDVSCAGGMGEKWCSNQISHTYLLARRSARQLKHYQTTSSLS